MAFNRTKTKQKFTRRIFELAHLCTITVIAGICAIAPDENPPLPRLVSGLGSRLGLVLGLGGNQTFSSGAIVLEPLLP